MVAEEPDQRWARQERAVADRRDHADAAGRQRRLVRTGAHADRETEGRTQAPQHRTAERQPRHGGEDEQHRPGDPEQGDRAHDGDPSVAVEEGGAEPSANGHRCQEHGERQRADRLRDVVAVDDCDGDPVVGDTLREREGEHEDTDEEGSRLSPRREGAASTDLAVGARRRQRLAGCVVLRRAGPVVDGEEARGGDDDSGGHDERHHRQMHGDGHAACDHGGTDQCASDGSEAEAGMEAGHDGPSEVLLDERPVHVHRHVPRAGGQPEEEQPDDDRCDTDPVAEGDRRQCHAEQGRRRGDQPARSEAGDHRARQRQRQ